VAAPQFTTLRGSADELEGYLKHKEAEAKEAEARALLQARRGGQ
jgi:hypothetical protein